MDELCTIISLIFFFLRKEGKRGGADAEGVLMGILWLPPVWPSQKEIPNSRMPVIGLIQNDPGLCSFFYFSWEVQAS